MSHSSIKVLALFWSYFVVLNSSSLAQISVSEARQAPIGQAVIVEGVVSRGWGQSFFIQDANAGIEVHQKSGALVQLLTTGQIKSGDRVRVAGVRQQLNNHQLILLEQGDFSSQSRVDVIARSNRSPKPLAVSYSDLVANPERYESRCVLVRNLTTTSRGAFQAGASYSLVADGLPNQNLQLIVPEGKSNVADAPSLSIPTSPFAFEGVLIRQGNRFVLAAVQKRDIYIPFVLTILHNNDGESKLLEAGSTPTLQEFGGVSRFKTLIDRLRSSALARGSGVLTLSSGDNFLAGAVFNANLQLPPDKPFYDAIAMESFGYDAICIGNHDLDFGPDVLARFISGFRGQNNVFLSANLDFSNEPELFRLQQAGRIAPSRVIAVNGERIGVIGLTTPLLRSISTPRNIIINENVASVVQREVDRLEAEGVNKIVLISHMQTLDADYELGRSIRGVDLVIAGGSDATLANDINHLVPGEPIQGPYPLYITDQDGIDVPNVTTGGDYKYVGHLVAWFNPVGELVWVDPVESRPYRVASTAYPDGVQRNPELVRLVDEPVRNYVATLASRVVAVTEDRLDGRRPPIRLQETGLGNLMADAILWQARQLAPAFGIERVDLAIQNGGGIRNNSEYPAGHRLTELNTFDIAAFSNFVGVAKSLSPLEVRRLIEHGVARLPNEGGQYCQIAGMRVEIDLSEPAIQYNATNGQLIREGSRVRNLILDDGTYVVYNGVVQPIRNLNVATIDFLARNSGNNLGGDNYPFRSETFVPMGRTYQQALFNYLVDGLGGVVSKEMYPHQDRGWRRMIRVTKSQLIHNSPDPTLETVDVFVNNRLFLDDFKFRSATPYIYVPCDQIATASFSINTQTNDPSTATVRVPIAFESQKNYQIIVTGLSNPASFASNPDGLNTSLSLNTVTGTSSSARDAKQADLMFSHGIPDAPTVRLRSRSNSVLQLDDLSYSTLKGPVGLNDVPTLIDVILPDGSLLGTWSFTPSPHIGQTSLIMASGFINPEANRNGKPFGLYVVSPDGDVHPLIRLGTSQQPFQGDLETHYISNVSIHQSELTVLFKEVNPGTCQLELYSLTGQQVAQYHFEGKAGETIRRDISTLPQGVYTYRLKTENTGLTQGKIIISR